jgi:hypothetical protein
MSQLAVLSREMVAEHSAGRRNLVEDPSWYLLNICCFEVYLRRRLCIQTHFLLYRYWMSVNRPPALALSDLSGSLATNAVFHIRHCNTMRLDTNLSDS